MGHCLDCQPASGDASAFVAPTSSVSPADCLAKMVYSLKPGYRNGVLIIFAAGIILVAFAPLGLAVFGCVLFGIGLAGWNLPLSILRRVTPPERVAWRTAQYRVAVDAGIFLGPFLSGILGEGPLWMLSASCGAMLGVLGVAMLFRRN